MTQTTPGAVIVKCEVSQMRTTVHVHASCPDTVVTRRRTVEKNIFCQERNL